MDPVLKECSLYFGDAQAACLKTLARCLRRGGRFHDAALCTNLAACAEACMRCWRSGLEGRVSEDEALACAAACERAARCCERLCEPELSRAARLLMACAERSAEAAQRPAPLT